MAFTFETQGSFEDTEKFFSRMSRGDIYKALDRYGEIGRAALASATPAESGETAASWTYEVKRERGTYSIIWGNTNIVGGTPVAVLLQVGHGTGTGGYVTGRDYINPAIRPVFDQMAAEVWKEVTS